MLIEIAASQGLEPERVQRLLATNEGVAEVRGQTARAYDLGITSVPTFIFAGRYAVTGAQEHGHPAVGARRGGAARRSGRGRHPRASQRTAPACEDDSYVA